MFWDVVDGSAEDLSIGSSLGSEVLIVGIVYSIGVTVEVEVLFAASIEEDVLPDDVSVELNGNIIGDMGLIVVLVSEIDPFKNGLKVWLGDVVVGDNVLVVEEDSLDEAR